MHDSRAAHNATHGNDALHVIQAGQGRHLRQAEVHVVGASLQKGSAGRDREGRPHAMGGEDYDSLHMPDTKFLSQLA